MSAIVASTSWILFVSITCEQLQWKKRLNVLIEHEELMGANGPGIILHRLAAIANISDTDVHAMLFHEVLTGRHLKTLNQILTCKNVPNKSAHKHTS